MSIVIDMIRGILGLGPAAPKDEYANLKPGDLEAYWAALNEIDQAERDGDITVGYRKFGIKNAEHWEAVQATFVRHHGESPEFSLAASTASFKQQMASTMSSDGYGYKMPAEYLEPVEGISLDKLALAKVRMEMQGPAALSALGMDAAKLGRVEAGWNARMGGNADPTAAAILGGLYHTFLTQVRAVLSRAA